MKIKKATTIAETIRMGNSCNRCGKCCTYGSGFLTKADITSIARKLKLTEEGLKKTALEPVKKFNTTLYRPLTIKKGKPYGTCMFFNAKKGCTIHEVKPLQCKIATCNEHGQELSIWFDLNYFVNPTDPVSIREWKLYLDSGGKNIPGGELESLVPDKKVLKKILNYEVLK
ncbi:YkgJ family cysteine cluster protein [Candidatus Woesearchaeota archaeon]|nr:YkgJ family cysteine cluster protein [Candidatus Woesearchaeota archaeon]